jgi:O-antigen/teichoic acid export membrane protein
MSEGRAPVALEARARPHGHLVRKRAMTRAALRVAAPPAQQALLHGLWPVVLSQIALAAAGVASMPVLARQLGAVGYGEFSLFITLLGVVTYQDVARQLLILEQARHRASADEVDGLTRLSTFLLVALAALVGTLALPLLAAVSLVAIAALHGLASRSYAALATRGDVGRAGALRNFAWAAAFAASAALSFVTRGPLAYCAPFTVALGTVLIAYRAWDTPREGADRRARAGESWWTRWSGWSAVRRSPHWASYRRAGLDLLGFTLASSAVASLDRILLQCTGGAVEFGWYCGASDVATRVHVMSSALAATLYPWFATQIAEQGLERTSRRFLEIASVTVLAYFAALVAMLCVDRPLLALFLGAEFAPSRPLFALMLGGVFVHAFGFLLTPWQRARGDFETQRKAYTRAAVLMLAIGIVTVPLYGATGALVAYLCGRTAELQLVWHELQHWSGAPLPRARLACAAVMLLALVTLGAQRFAQGAP